MGGSKSRPNQAAFPANTIISPPGINTEVIRSSALFCSALTRLCSVETARRADTVWNCGVQGRDRAD
ncbi:hypothetical protein KIL84_019095 [Mauremys mutica]|uniref:Uncharacterized protein n=1 Tax=Mauremys mutica TaxID=74926 RepID=A0A9D4BA02_9SAUR|nr:hypothetical protein KIL84_019095 [Mauremys mutica]